VLALELNDAGLVLAAAPDADGAQARVVASAPGVACVSEAGLLTGAAAAQQAKLNPQRSHNRYWQELSAVPLGRAPRPQLSAADLAFEQLRSLLLAAPGERRLLVAVPAGYAPEQLGLLLGITAEAGIAETGLVDAALAACALAPVPPHVLHLELQRHRAVLTAIEQDGNGARRARFELDAGCGLQRVEQLCIELVAGNFVRQTRFDPLYHGSGEQRLADGTWDWLRALGESETVTVRLPSGEESLQVELARSQWLAAAESCYAAIVQLVQGARPAGQAVELRVGARAQSLPGLLERLRTLGSCTITALPEGAAALGALRQHGAIFRGAEPALLYRLPLATTAPPATGAPAPESRNGSAEGAAATHVLCAGRAWELRAEPLTVGTQVPEGVRALPLPAGLAGVSRVHCRLSLRDGAAVVEDLSTYGSFVNEERIHGQALLKRGDRLRLGAPGIVLEAIELVDEHPTPPL
jgi:hypothetical protein